MFPSIQPIPVDKLFHGVGFVDPYWLLDTMNYIKSTLKEQLSHINDLDLLYDLRDNELNDFIDKLFDVYFYKLSPHYDVTYNDNSFIADIDFIRGLFNARIRALSGYS